MVCNNSCAALGHRATTAMTCLLVAAVAMLLSAQVTSAAAAAASAAASDASSPALSSNARRVQKEDKLEIVKVGAASAEVFASTRRPSVVKLVGHPHLRVDKMFHHLTLEVFDDGGLAAQDCQLQRITKKNVKKKQGDNATTTTTTTTTATKTTATKTGSSGGGSGGGNFLKSKVRQRRGPGYGKAAGTGAPAVLATFGPYDSAAGAYNRPQSST
jgi:hypothetical protein